MVLATSYRRCVWKSREVPQRPQNLNGNLKNKQEFLQRDTGKKKSQGKKMGAEDEGKE